MIMQQQPPCRSSNIFILPSMRCHGSICDISHLYHSLYVELADLQVPCIEVMCEAGLADCTGSTCTLEDTLQNHLIQDCLGFMLIIMEDMAGGSPEEYTSSITLCVSCAGFNWKCAMCARKQEFVRGFLSLRNGQRVCS